MIFDRLTFPSVPGSGAQKCAIKRPIHGSNSHNKVGWISSNGLGGETITDGRADGRTDVLVGFFMLEKEPTKQMRFIP